MPRPLGVALLLLALPIPVLADYKESYREGIKAVDGKQWPEVAKRMREALAENPKEGEKVKFYGMRFETYLPHFYLGVALVNTGDCDGALKAFTTSEEQGAIRGTSKHAELLERRKGCEAKVVRAPTPPPTPLPTPRATPPPEATPIPAPTPVAKSPEPTPVPAAPSPTAEKPASTVDVAGAARAYFSGRYGDAAGALASLKPGSGRSVAQALLLRSAARYALYRIGGEQDAPLRRRAVEDAVSARQADASLMPDPAAFSPAFLKFYRDARP